VLRSAVVLVRCGIGGLISLLAACDVGPSYHRPDIDVPPTYRASAATPIAVWPSTAWWQAFRAPDLDALIRQAQTHNFDMAAAAARVRQADAQVRIVGAALLPTINATADSSWQHEGVRAFGAGSALSGGGNASFDLHDYSAGLNASYLVDFWGHNVALRQSALASARFSRFDEQTVALTVVANVATTWFTALSFADRLLVARHNLANAEQTLRAIQGRFVAGTASALDLAQQQTLTEGERAAIPSLQSQLEQQLIALGILTGQPPERITAQPGSLTTLALPPASPGMPAALLSRRPDVAAAEAQLIAQNFSIKVARAAFFPSVSVSGSVGYQASALNQLINPGAALASAAASLAAPIFDGGTLRGNLELAKGRYDELLADYRRTVVQAFSDVDNAMTAWRYATRQEALQRIAVGSARRAAAIARAQVDAGTVDITTVLTAETTLFSDEDTLVQDRLTLVNSLVALYKALGGGWEEPVTPESITLTPAVLPGAIALPVGGNVQ
jgi:multidrug efflux system outer membrane protein